MRGAPEVCIGNCIPALIPSNEYIMGYKRKRECIGWSGKVVRMGGEVEVEKGDRDDASDVTKSSRAGASLCPC
jgi:hypothetical protein